MRKQKFENVTPAGLKYQVEKTGIMGATTLLLFQGNVDMEIIYQEEKVKEKDCFIFSEKLLKLCKEKLENPEFYLENLMCSKPDKNQDVPIKALKKVMIFLSEELLENQQYLKEVIQLAEKSRAKLVFLGEARLEKNDRAYKRFCMQYPDMVVKRIKSDYKGFLEKKWCDTFMVELPIEADKLLARLRFYGELNSENIQNFVSYMANHTESENLTPTELEINSFLEELKGKGWKDKLKQLVAMDSVKEKIKELIQKQIYLRALKEQGMNKEYMAVRAVISGNAGVGKSTLLELMQHAFQEEMQEIRAKHISCRSLISDHVGGSEERLRKMVADCDLLILDELGGLVIDDKFNAGIIQELVYMAEKRKDMHMFFIGYEKDVQQFLERNQGLRSRIQNFIHITDYSQEELLEIGISMIKNVPYVLENEEAARKILKDFVQRLVKIPNYGNARAMRVLVDQLHIIKAIAYEETRILDMTVTREQLELAVERYFSGQPKAKPETRIGFEG